MAVIFTSGLRFRLNYLHVVFFSGCNNELHEVVVKGGEFFQQSKEKRLVVG